MKAFIKSMLGEKYYLSLYRSINRHNPFYRSYRESVKITERKKFYGDLIQKGDLCFDIGANTGNRVAAFLAAGAKVVAVEPQESCCRLLYQKFGDSITIINKGAGAENGIKTFYRSTVSALSSFSTDWIAVVKGQRFGQAEWEQGGDIEMITLDSLIRQFGKPVYIKIDVEGYEEEVLAGLSQAVPLLSFEYTVPERTNTVLACLEKVMELNGTSVCNYTIKEQMRFVLPVWVEAAEMLHIVQSSLFEQASAGDIFVRQIP